MAAYTPGICFLSRKIFMKNHEDISRFENQAHELKGLKNLAQDRHTTRHYFSAILINELELDRS